MAPNLNDLPSRIRNRIVVQPFGCWDWTGAKINGYGTFRLNGPNRPAHRAIYELLVGPIDRGLVTDHLCRRPSCVNPTHLEPVTQQINVRRGNAPAAFNAQRTECVNGHPFDEANTYTHPNGKRKCRACRAERMRRVRAKRLTGACIAIAMSLPLTLVAPASAEAIPSMSAEVDRAIHEASVEFGVSEAKMRRVARCESGMRHNARSRSGSYIGLFQQSRRYGPGRIAAFNRRHPDYPINWDLTNPFTNARLSGWMMRAPRGLKHWPVCGRR